MNNLRIYGIGMACLLGGAAWLFMSAAEREAPRETDVVRTRGKKTVDSAAPRKEEVARSSKLSRTNLKGHGAVPILAAAAENAEPNKQIYENPADDPESWSDFQAAIYAYKATVLGPRIQECWHTVTGLGEIIASHDYDIVDGIARPMMVAQEDGELVPNIQIVQADESLSDEDIESALACLRTAAMDTEFHFVGLNGETDLNDTFGGYWGWDTPALLEGTASRMP